MAQADAQLCTKRSVVLSSTCGFHLWAQGCWFSHTVSQPAGNGEQQEEFRANLAKGITWSFTHAYITSAYCLDPTLNMATPSYKTGKTWSEACCQAQTMVGRVGSIIRRRKKELVLEPSQQSVTYKKK